MNGNEKKFLIIFLLASGVMLFFGVCLKLLYELSIVCEVFSVLFLGCR